MVVISKTDILEQLEKIERILIRKDNPPIRKIINEETKKMERPVKKFLTYMGIELHMIFYLLFIEDQE